MLFTEPLFLFMFLPVLLALYYGARTRLRNPLLLSASLLFYASGAGADTLILLTSIMLNYLCGLAVGRSSAARVRKLALGFGVAGNVSLLAALKYSAFIANNLNPLAAALRLAPLTPGPPRLPLGISFFTFMGMSYLADVYRRRVESVGRLDTFSLYMSLFPHLIAGPIVRLSEIAPELASRRATRADFAEGVRRFVVGLGKKIIIADALAPSVDQIFNAPTAQLTTGVAWLGVVGYTLQIYFDFSGYSDMAIGLARMFGFHFPENFNYPYAARSLTEFWRRWHMTLSAWFRDYVYIPLGGNRASAPRVSANLLTTMLLCGLWHGAGWGFIIWGAYHGLFLVFERAGFAAWLGKRHALVRHAYTLLVLMLGWSFFRTASGRRGFEFLASLVGFARGSGVEQNLRGYLNAELLPALLAGAICCLPIVPILKRWHERFDGGEGAAAAVVDSCFRAARLAAVAFIFLASAAQAAASTYKAFIYFRF